MVSMLAFYSDDPSLNPADVNNFSVKFVTERTKININQAWVGQLTKNEFAPLEVS